MYRIYSRFDTGTLCEWHECTGCESPLQLGEYESAKIWLSGFLFNDEQLMNLRVSAHHCSDKLGLTQRSGKDVVEDLARMIGNGELRVCHKQTVVIHEEPMVMGVAPAEPSQPAPPVSRGRSAPVRPPPPEPSTLPSNVDAKATAAVLTEAAESGTPFCEACEKAKKERESAEAVA